MQKGLQEKLNNKYLLNIPFEDDGRILFNRTNGAIYTLSSDEYNDLIYGCVCRDNEIYKGLLEYDILAFTDIELTPSINSISLVIELSTLCNLNCAYCYQKKNQVRAEITAEVIKNIYSYLGSVLETNSTIKEVIIGFIGGEPFLHKEKIYEITEVIGDICKKFGVHCLFHIDTNGTVDFSEYFNSMNDLQISVALTSKKDHNKYRVGQGFDSFDKTVENLKNLKNLQSKLVLRYNTNSDNIKDFDEFLSFVKSELPAVNGVDPMYTYNYKHNKKYKNILHNDDFAIWNSTEAIDLLIKHSFPIAVTIATVLQLCVAYQPFSCKVHSDGYITLCDAMEYSKLLNISELSKDINLLENAYIEYKNYNPLNDSMCMNCAKIIQCQGRVFCREMPCNYGVRINEVHFLQTFIKHSLLGNERFFLGMKDD